MKTLYVSKVADRGCESNSFKLTTKRPNGKHEHVEFGTGTLSGSKVTVKVQGETLTFPNAVEAIAKATQEGYAVVAA